MIFKFDNRIYVINIIKIKDVIDLKKDRERKKVLMDISNIIILVEIA